MLDDINPIPASENQIKAKKYIGKDKIIRFKPGPLLGVSHAMVPHLPLLCLGQLLLLRLL